MLEEGVLDGEPIPIVDGYPLTLVFDTDLGEAGGTAACNQYGGVYTLDGNSLVFDELFQTEMACVDDGVMGSEARFLAAMALIDTFEMDGERLRLAGEGVDLVFAVDQGPDQTTTTTAPAVASLDPTPFAWILESGTLDDQPIVIVAGFEPTLVFDIDLGNAGGRAACNTYLGPYTIEDTNLRFGELVQTLAGCLNEDVMDSETEFMTAMRSVGSYTMDEERLTLSGGSARLVFTVVDPTSIPWSLISGTVDGDPLPRVPGHPITLVFTEDGAGGTAACNGYGGAYQLSGSPISFEPPAVTAMACSPPEVMTLESAYIDALMSVDSLTTTGTNLKLTGAGVELEFVSQVPVPTAELTGVVWELETVLDGGTASTPVGDRATLELFTDGSLIGSTGCRSLTGRYVVTGAEVKVTELAADGECPEEVQVQDSLVVTVLGDAFMVEIAGDSLTVNALRQQIGLIYNVSS